MYKSLVHKLTQESRIIITAGGKKSTLFTARVPTNSGHSYILLRQVWHIMSVYRYYSSYRDKQKNLKVRKNK